VAVAAGQDGIGPGEGVLAWLRTLIELPTVSRDSNLALIEVARDALAGAGATCRLTTDSGGGKANLFATFGDRGQGGLVFSGHTDVVPVDGQDWATDPFEAVLRDGRVFGRGAADMKGFIAAVLDAAPAMAAAAGERDFHVALSFDEEVGCRGAPLMIEDMARAGLRPSACIVGEPTDMRVIARHKGAHAYLCRVCGREAHASLAPSGVNAIEFAARLIDKARILGLDLREREAPDPDYDVPFTTIGANVVTGGSATNIVPGLCEVRFDIRHLPATDVEAELVAPLRAFAREVLEPEMRRIAPETGIAITRLGGVPALNTDPGDPVVAFAQALACDPGKPGAVAFGTEAGLFQAAGVATVICGPGAIAQAHRPDEFVTLDQLASAKAFILGAVATAGRNLA
jgi:acetylornithine deacetylase